MVDKSFMDIDFPVKEVSHEAAREKNVRHGHISRLHIWWARRPLASSRASIYACLTPIPETKEGMEAKRKFIGELASWRNPPDARLIERAKSEILRANKGEPPKVIDPFAGGGAIPLEALRLGCETYASDLDPVAVLLEKATIEFPQKYSKRAQIGSFVDVATVNPLLKDVKKWSDWVLAATREELYDSIHETLTVLFRSAFCGRGQ